MEEDRPDNRPEDNRHSNEDDLKLENEDEITEMLETPVKRGFKSAKKLRYSKGKLY